MLLSDVSVSMQTTNDTTLKSLIMKGLRADPNKLFTELSSQLAPAADTEILKSQLDRVAELLVEEGARQEDRKVLSRKIGQAKRNKEECSHLIAQVSQYSQELGTLSSRINEKMLELQLLLTLGGEADQAIVPLLPQHLDVTQLTDDEDIATSLPNGFTVNHTEFIDPAEWQVFVEQTAHATVYHEACWKEIIKSNFNHDVHQITCRDESGKLVGVLPLSHLNSQVFGSFTVSMPYFNYGGPLASNRPVEEAMLAHAANLSDELGCSHMEIREVSARPNWKSVQRKVSMILPLPADDDLLDAGLGSKLRAQVKKAESNDLSVKFGGVELLDHFYDVFSRNMRDLGTPVYGKKIFADIIKQYPESAFIAVVYRNEKPLAVGFLLGYRDKLEIPWASSIRSQNHLGGNMFMYRSILAEAISRKYQYFDFGRSTINASTHKFKKQWGAKEHSLHWHYWTRDSKDLPEINPDNPKYKLVIKIWQILPVFVTRIIGPHIARNLP